MHALNSWLNSVPVYKAWLIGTPLVLVGAVALTMWSVKRGKPLHAQVTTIALLVYVLFVLIFWSTSSHAFFSDVRLAPQDGGDAKRLLLAGTAGLLAQIVIWLNRFAHDSNIGSRVLPLYADAALGMLCGVVGLAFIATVHSVEIEKLTNAQAATSGFGGGALGLGLISVIRMWFPQAEKAAESAHARVGTCMYAGQEYSDGATVSMAGNGPAVVKTCDGASGRWRQQEPAATREEAVPVVSVGWR
jgi:hypothetical protein